MKKRLLLVVLISFVVIPVINAQRTIEKVVEIVTSQARNMEPQNAIIAVPQIAELKVEMQKYSKTYTYFHNGSVDMVNERARALSDFQKEFKADVVVGALIDTKMNASVIEVSVQGYPAKYVEIRPATKDDLWMLEFHNSINKYNNTESVNKK